MGHGDSVHCDAPPILGRANISNFAMSNGSNSVSELTTDSLPNLGMGILPMPTTWTSSTKP